jgi:cytochrome c peroxidase
MLEGAVKVLMPGTGLELSSNWRGASTMRGGAVTAPADLHFAGHGTIDLRLFTNMAASFPDSAWMPDGSPDVAQDFLDGCRMADAIPLRGSITLSDFEFPPSGRAWRLRRGKPSPRRRNGGTVSNGQKGVWVRFGSRRRLVVSALILALTSCGSEGGSPPSSTPAGVAELTTIDFANVANYSAPTLPAYFDQTVAVLDNSPASNAINDRVATLGRVLFYDLRLSTNDKASCTSCHQQAFGFTDPMRFSNGISNAATTDFHAMRLGNLRYWRPGSTFWDRRVVSVEAQASQPFHSLVEMGWGGAAGGFDSLIRKMRATRYYPDLFTWAFGSSTITEARIQQALAQFVRAMISSSSRWDEGYAQVFSPTTPNRALDVDLPNFTGQENRGRQLFMTSAAQGGAGCSSCHLPPTFALTANARSNGLDAGETRVFKAPSLRSVGLTGPYMHDGRFATLAEVVDFYDHGIQKGPALDNRLRHGRGPRRLNLSAADRAALVAFLMTLTDRALTTDARFSDPFRR